MAEEEDQDESSDKSELSDIAEEGEDDVSDIGQQVIISHLGDYSTCTHAHLDFFWPRLMEGVWRVQW